MAKTCLHKAAATLALLLMVATAQGIRLDAGSKAALDNQVLNVNKSVEKEVVIKADSVGGSSGEVEATISEEKNRAGHGMPDIHVDYYGPRGHNPRHH